MSEESENQPSVVSERPWEDLLYDPDPSTRHTRRPTYSESGVDLSQIRWFLDLTPSQRLETLQSMVDLVCEVRNAREAYQVRRYTPRS